MTLADPPHAASTYVPYQMPHPPCAGRAAETPPSFADAVRGSEEAVTKQMRAVTTGISGIVEKVQQVRQQNCRCPGLS